MRFIRTANILRALLLALSLPIVVFATTTTPSPQASIPKTNVSSSTTLSIPPIDTHGIIATILSYTEAFRLKQLIFFTNLKAKNKGVLENTTIKDISTFLTPDAPGVPGQDSTPAQPSRDTHTTQYALLILATAGVSFFDHKAVFYITLVLIALFAIRFIFGRFLDN